MSEVYDEDFTEQIVNVQWSGGETEFSDGSYIITNTPPPEKSLSLTISFFIFLPSEGWAGTTRFKDMLQWGYGLTFGDSTTSSIIFEGDGGNRCHIVADLNSKVVSGVGDDTAPFEYYFTSAGASTISSPDPGSGPGPGGVLSYDAWHHVFVTCDMTDVLTLPDPDELGNPGSGLRFQDVFFVARSEIYLDRVSVAKSDSSTYTPRGKLVPPGYTEMLVFTTAEPDSENLTSPDFEKSYTISPDQIPPFKRDVVAGFAGINFAGRLGVPNLSGRDFENIPGDPGTNTPVRLAGVQIWASQYIQPSPANLDKFVKLGRDGKPQMVPVSVAEKAFGTPTYSYDGPPAKFTKNATPVGAGIKKVQGPPKAQ